MEKKIQGKVWKKARTRLWIHKTSRWIGVPCSTQGIALSHSHIHLLTARAAAVYLRANSCALFNLAICMADQTAVSVLISTSTSEEKVSGFAHNTSIWPCLAFIRLTEDGFLQHCTRGDLGNQLHHTEVSHW